MIRRLAPIATPRGRILAPLFVGILAGAFLLATAQSAAGFGFITKWGSFGARAGQFTRPTDVATDGAGNVYVSDPRDRVEKFTSRGEFILQWGSAGHGRGEFDTPAAITIDRAGHVYVVDGGNDRVEKFTSRGRFLGQWGHHGSGPGSFDRATGIASDPAGNVYVVDQGNHRIQKFTSRGRFLSQWGGQGRGPGQFGIPAGVDTDEHGNVYVTDTGENTGGVSKFSSDGTFLLHWGSAGSGTGMASGNPPFYAWGIATDGAGHVYADDLNRPTSRIYEFNYDGVLLGSFGGLGAADGLFENPAGLATDGRGDLYVADQGNHRIQKFGAPSAVFELVGKPTADPGRGTARLVANLPGVGDLEVTGQGIESARRIAKRAGDLALPVTPSEATRRQLERTGHATVALRVTYRPTTAGASLSRTRSRQVRLIERPNLLTATLEGARLYVRVSCPANFEPLCLGRAAAVSARDRCERRNGRRICRQGTRLTTVASIHLPPGHTKVIGLRVRTEFRRQVEQLARHPGRRSLLVRQLIHAKGFEHGRPRAVYHVYGVRADT